MAARWRGEDGEINAGNSDFMASNSPNEPVLSRAGVEGMDMDTQSCVDHSILAILEDSTVPSECKSRAEEESERLLSALTEMLDCVEDDGRTLSPFDTLPDTKFLSQAEYRDNTVGSSFAQRLRPRSKTPTTASTTKSDGEKGKEGTLEKSGLSQMFKLQGQMFHPKNKKADAEVEVFTSTSLVSLVKLMHPYCLKLRVEEGDKPTHPTIFSHEEVWKYERPTEDSDEEINVVSDDEAPVIETKIQDEVEERRDSGQVLKSVLLNGNSRSPPSKGKKRVSFGPVRVASLDESVENGLNESNSTNCHTSESESLPLNSTSTLENPAIEASATSSEVNYNKTEDQQPKVQTKAKSLSLQQYRQLRQKRQPLVEKQGNYTTKWPSVPEPPKELTPILCLQKQNGCKPKMPQHYPDPRKPDFKSSHLASSPRKLHPSEAKYSTNVNHSRLNHQRTESKVLSPASPLPDILHESKRSPVKKPTILSSDPPNPVLLPLPVPQTASPSTSNSSSASEVEFLSRDSSLQSNRQPQELQTESSAAPLQRQAFSSELNPQVSPLIKDYSQESPAPLQDMKTAFSEIADDSYISQEQENSQSIKSHIQKCSLSPPEGPQHLPETPQAPSPDAQRPVKCSSVSPHFSQPLTHIDSGAVTEVLTHSMSPPEEPPPPQSRCRVQGATADSGIEATDLTSLLEQFEETQAKEERVCENEPSLVRAASLTAMSSVGPLESLSTAETQKLQVLEAVDIPEPLSTEIILSTQQPARRKNPPSKAIQIIDPRPLPSRKTHTIQSESAAALASHMYAHVSADHDYCGSVDHSPVNASQRSRAKPPLLKDASQTTNEHHVMTQGSQAAGEEKNQITTVKTQSVLQHQSDQPRARSETADRALQFADCAAKEDRGRSEDKPAPCTFPTPPPSPPVRGREKRRYRRRSPRSDSSSSSRSSSSSSSSSSASRSPKRLRLHRKRSESSSCSSSPCCSVSRSPPRRYRSGCCTPRYSRSRSRSWSRSTSRSRSPSPQICRKRWRDFCSSSRESRKLRREHEIRIQKLKAIDERRVVYVGRIRRSMTHDELRERFSQFGEVECVSLHFRDRGDHYAFVTFYNMEDAFAAIDNGGKLRQPDEMPFDICFGGRRQFCNTNYTDLDANRDAEASPSRTKFEDLDFDSLLKQAQRGLKT